MDDLIATYYFRPRDGVTADFAAQAISEEQTTGTWTNLSTVNEHTASCMPTTGRLWISSLWKTGDSYENPLSL